MGRLFRIVGITIGGIVVIGVVARLLVRPNVQAHPVMTPSGHEYNVLSDLVSSDGRYYITYLAQSADPEKVEEGAYDLMRMVTANPRAATLKTISVTANVGSGMKEIGSVPH
jgi:hypothetical protein